MGTMTDPLSIEDILEIKRSGHIFGECGVFLDKGDKAQCHICGGWYVSVASHAWQSHGILADEYRSLFELNYSQGLTSDNLRMRQVERGKREYNDGIASKYITPRPFTEASRNKTRGRKQRLQSVKANIETHPASYIEITCIICGNKFIRTLTGKRLTCSQACRKQRRRDVTKLQSGKMSQSFWQGDIDKIKERNAKLSITRRLMFPRTIKYCVICGKAYDVIPSHSNKRTTCSKRECMLQRRSDVAKGRKHSAESRIKMSIAKKKYWDKRKSEPN